VSLLPAGIDDNTMCDGDEGHLKGSNSEQSDSGRRLEQYVIACKLDAGDMAPRLRRYLRRVLVDLRQASTPRWSFGCSSASVL
jgi:hypothetical protein